jgi:flagellar operon protein (TIGR03826 family)
MTKYIIEMHGLWELNIMEMRNCRSCGKIFAYIGKPVCPTCSKKDEEDFKRVKEYLYENPGASVVQISNDLEISVRKIKTYLREGRLEIIGDEGNLLLECEICGKSIRTGRFCQECSDELVRDIKSVSSQMKKPEVEENKKKMGGAMRYLNRRD